MAGLRICGINHQPHTVQYQYVAAAAAAAVAVLIYCKSSCVVCIMTSISHVLHGLNVVSDYGAMMHQQLHEHDSQNVSDNGVEEGTQAQHWYRPRSKM